jgi:hypothetical protein
MDDLELDDNELNDVDEMTKGGCDYHLGAGEAKFIHPTDLRAPNAIGI